MLAINFMLKVLFSVQLSFAGSLISTETEYLLENHSNDVKVTKENGQQYLTAVDRTALQIMGIDPDQTLHESNPKDQSLEINGFECRQRQFDYSELEKSGLLFQLAQDPVEVIRKLDYHNVCKKILTPGLPTLSLNQQWAIQAMLDLDFNVSVRDFMVNGINRTVVLLGETHIKSKVASRDEMQLANYFDFRLLEGYGGTGHGLATMDRVLIPFIKVAYPVTEYVIMGERSSINKARQTGFLLDLTGAVYFNDCKIGFANKNGFYYHPEHIQKLVRYLPSHLLTKFFQQLQSVTHHFSNHRGLIKTEKLSLPTRHSKCELEALFTERDFEKKNLYIESGDLTIWDDNKVCAGGATICLANERPSRRDLRMMDNIYAAFASNPDQTVGLVIVGRFHVHILHDLLNDDWPTTRTSFLKKNQDN